MVRIAGLANIAMLLLPAIAVAQEATVDIGGTAPDATQAQSDVDDPDLGFDDSVAQTRNLLTSVDTGDPLVDAQLAMICAQKLPELAPLPAGDQSGPPPGRRLEAAVTGALDRIYKSTHDSERALSRVASVLSQHGCDPTLAASVPVNNWIPDQPTSNMAVAQEVVGDPVRTQWLADIAAGRPTNVADEFKYAEAGARCAGVMADVDNLCSGALNPYVTFLEYTSVTDPERSLHPVIIGGLVMIGGAVVGWVVEKGLDYLWDEFSKENDDVTTEGDIKQRFSGDPPAPQDFGGFNPQNEGEKGDALNLVPADEREPPPEKPEPQDLGADVDAFMSFIANVWGPRVSRTVGDYRACTEPVEYRQTNYTPIPVPQQQSPMCDIDAVTRDLEPPPFNPDAPPNDDFSKEVERDRWARTIGIECPQELTADQCRAWANDRYLEEGYGLGFEEYCVLYPTAQPCEVVRREAWLHDTVAHQYNYGYEQATHVEVDDSWTLNPRLKACYSQNVCAPP